VEHNKENFEESSCSSLSFKDSSYMVTLAGKVISLDGYIISEKSNWISVCSSHKAIMVVYCPFSTWTMVTMNCPWTNRSMKILQHSQNVPNKESSKWLEACTSHWSYNFKIVWSFTVNVLFWCGWMLFWHHQFVPLLLLILPCVRKCRIVFWVSKRIPLFM